VKSVYGIRNIKRTFALLAAGFLMILIIPQPANSIEFGEGVDFSGQMRWRSELDGRDFDNRTVLLESPYLRTRIGLNVTAIENTELFVQFQDSRNLGANSSGLTNDINVGTHQAYIKLNKFIRNDLSMQVGRFEAAYGRQRLIGPVGWSNVGRTFDGIRFSCEKENRKLDLFSLKVREGSFWLVPTHEDWVFYGLYGTFMEKKLDLFFLFDWDQQENGNGTDALRRYTTGFYYNRVLEERLNFEMDAAFQGGKEEKDKIAAFMLAGDLAYKLEGALNEVGFGFDITSGDDDPSDDDINSFNNLYYTGHKFRGYMDQFIGTTTPGLMDIIFRGKIKANDKFALLIDLHHFQTMKDYTGSNGDDTKNIGQEIDLTGKLPLVEGLSMQGGASVFFASSDYIYEADPGLWFYAMITADVK